MQIGGYLTQRAVGCGAHTLHQLRHAAEAAADVVLRRLNGIPIRKFQIFQVRDQRSHRVLRIPHIVHHAVHLVDDPCSGTLQIGTGLADGLSQTVQLPHEDLQSIFFKFHHRGGLHLTGDAADLFPSENLAPVLAVQNAAGLGARDTADVVTHAGISHIGMVSAVTDHADAVTGNTADIRDRTGSFGMKHGIQRNIRQFNFVFPGGLIDGRMVFTAADGTRVFSGDAAYKVAAENAAADTAIFNGAGDHVFTSDTADVLLAGHGTGEAAAPENAVVLTGKTADPAAGAFAPDLTFQMQIADHSGFRQIPEEALVRALHGQIQAPDGMAVSFKPSAENGNTGKIHSRQIQVRPEVYHQIPAVAVQTAVFHQFCKTVRICNRKYFFLGRHLLIRADRKGGRQQHHAGQHQRKHSFIHGPHLPLLQAGYP